MADLKVQTLSRLAQWRIDNRGSSYQQPSPFKMGIWNWHLQVERRRDRYEHLFVRLFPESSEVCKQQLPFARFVMRVSVLGPSRKVFTSQVYERQLQTREDFGWSVDCAFNGRFIIDVEFLDLKICPVNGGEATSVWPGDGSEILLSVTTHNTVGYVSRMLEENIHSDLTINTCEGSLKAHKAILCACSPVFQSMFHHDLQEKESSVVNIKDISLKSFTALLNYLYGTIKQGDFWRHRLTLLDMADKYGIVDLKDACEKSLLEDICSDNVLERLRVAWIHQLDNLKKGCLKFLFEFRKVYDVKEEISNFFNQAEGELKLEMLTEVLQCLETCMPPSC